MKKLLIGALAIALASCGSSDKKGEQARQDYNRALGDSIAIISQEIDSCESQAKFHNDRVATWLNSFEQVNNPREAGGYLIFTPAKSKYPPVDTDLTARINDSGQLELVAALRNGVFDQLRVSSGQSEMETAVVPNDQALNYRTQGLTTVLFTGGAADSVAQLIANNALNPVKVVYLDGRKVRMNIPLSESSKKMVMSTWMLYSNQQEAMRLQRRAAMLHEKINLLRAHRDRNGGLDGDTVK